MYGGMRQGMDQQTPDPWMGGGRSAPVGMGGWPPPDGGMNKPLPAQFPGMGAPIQPPMDKGPQFMTGGGLQSGPMGMGGTAVGPPGAGGPMPPWLQSIGALIAQRRGMMGNDPWGQGMGRNPFPPGYVGAGPEAAIDALPPSVSGVAGPPAAAPKPPAPVAATPPPTPQVKPQRMAQGRPVSERDGVTGVEGRHGGWQKLGKSAMRRLK